MDEDGSMTVVEGGEDGVEGFVAEVDAVFVGFEGDAIAVQVVEGAGELGEGTLNVGHREGGEEAELAGSAAFEVCAGVIAEAGDLSGECVVVADEVDAGGGDGEDAFGDVAGRHHVEVIFLGPGGYRRHAVRILVAMLGEGFAVASEELLADTLGEWCFMCRLTLGGNGNDSQSSHMATA